MPTRMEEKKIKEIVERSVYKVFKKISKERKKSNLVYSLAEKGGSFDFLFEEPNLYSEKDICKKAI